MPPQGCEDKDRAAAFLSFAEAAAGGWGRGLGPVTCPAELPPSAFSFPSYHQQKS